VSIYRQKKNETKGNTFNLWDMEKRLTLFLRPCEQAHKDLKAKAQGQALSE